jgi:hypothetical protein
MGHPASKIYAIFYTVYIPIGHALTSLCVFGWPEKYLPSLMANAPIGLSAMAIGTALTGFLSQVGFNAKADEMISSIIGTSKPVEEEEGEFYSSLVVMVATGVWCFVLSLYVNSEKKTDVKEKEL